MPTKDVTSNAAIIAYTAYEVSAGAALADVQALCRHVARGSGGTFDDTTIPTMETVCRWLTTATAWASGVLRNGGMSQTQTDPHVLAILQELIVYDVCARVEISQPAADSTGEPSARFQEFSKRRADLFDFIDNGYLSTIDGVGFGPVRTPVVGGISLSRKKVADDDTDRTQHRVKRNQFQRPGVPQPSQTDDYTRP